MKQYKIRVTARAEPFWECWSSYLLIFRDNWSLNPSIHIHVDLHAHTRFAVDKVAGSEPEGLHWSAQPPCCWVECRFHRLTLMFAVVQGKHGCFRDSHRGCLKFQTKASIKTWCGTEQGAISGFWISGSHYGRTKRQWMPNRIVKWNYNCKDPLRKPSGCQRSSASLQRRCNLWYQMCFWQLTHVNYSHLFKTCADAATERPLRYIRPITTNDNLLSLQAVK